ncbi:MAG TPA: VOC family protein, partial [Chthoniobacterales bacterium]|nr:VOC family protein [Chthoniobacterales bacterium]
MKPIRGLHHITAIAGPAQENLDFYAGVLGMRLVKKSVNQDDPGTYHLFYADAEGHPGSDLTFFPWPQLAPHRAGYGLSTEVSLAVPPGSLTFWSERLQSAGTALRPIETRFGERVLPLVDPHGLPLALVESESSLGRGFAPWERSPIPLEYQIRGLECARLVEAALEPTVAFLTAGLGFHEVGREAEWIRFGLGEATSGQYIDLRDLPDGRRGAWGTGSVHHLAWRVENDEHELEVRTQ